MKPSLNWGFLIITNYDKIGSCEVERMMRESKDFENTCFVIMPISDPSGYEPGHFTKVYEQIFKPAIEEAGYTSFRVDENMLSDSILLNIFDAIQSCPMALCDLSSRNPNVLYELGLRQAYDKPVVMVKDEKTEKIFDVSGINTHPYQSNRLYENVITAKETIKAAIMSTKESESETWSVVRILKTREAILKEEKITDKDEQDFFLRTIMNQLNSIKEQINFNTNRDTNRNIDISRAITRDRNKISLYDEDIVDYNSLKWDIINLQNELGRNPTIEDVSKEMGISKPYVNEINKKYELGLEFDKAITREAIKKR